MDNKITITALAGSLSLATGRSKRQCEEFLKEFFKLAAETLSSDELLRIKGFGTFKVVEMGSREGVNVATGEKQEISSFKKVVFAPAKDLAAEINAPFEDFESVEVDDDFPEEVLDEEMELKEDSENREENLGNESIVSPIVLETGSEEESEDDLITIEAYDAGPDEVNAEEHDPVIAANYVSSTSDSLENGDSENEDVREENNSENDEEDMKNKFGLGFLVGALLSLAICLIIFILGCFFAWWPQNFDRVKVEQTVPQEDVAIVEPQDSVVAVVEETVLTKAEEPIVEPEEKPVDKKERKVYDTVSTTRYLTTIAQEHYGNYNFWPYIYKENENKLGHPDRITPGTKVVVPPLSKYGVDASNKSDLEKAKEMGQEIYSRYRKRK